MVIDEHQCQAVLDAERRAAQKLVVTFNCRYIPKFQRIKEVLLANPIGKIISVDFNWYLDTTHGGEYMRRWHRLRDRGGTLLVHKATHHFDLINWFLDADPVDVTARGGLEYYGRNNPYRHDKCRGCPHKDKCKFYWDINADAVHKRLYADCESADGYIRDGCVWDERIDIYDTMNAVVTYSNGVRMTYSLNAFLPMEGIRLAFNGTEGRFEVRIFDKQPWKPAGDEAFIARPFGDSRFEKVQLPEAEGPHGGGDARLREVVFRRPELPPHMRLPDSRAGAMSCLTGIAARKSIEQDGKVVQIADLVKFA
jgi:predicted dehydrogenase